MGRSHQPPGGKALLPKRHIVDAGYLDAELLVRSKRDHGVELLGPTCADYKWQARAATGFDAGSFRVDRGSEQATGPEGRASLSWTPAVDKRCNQVVKIQFSMKDCEACEPRQV
jgi:transposase